MITGSCIVQIALSLACLPHLQFSLASAQQPIQAKWLTKSIGPDGPWQVVEVTLGLLNKLGLYPGGVGVSWVIPTEYCELNQTDPCYTSTAGTYNGAKKSQYGAGEPGNSVYEVDSSQFALGLDVQPLGTGAIWTDRFSAIPNVSFSLVERQMFTYPSGQWYPAFAGCLGLGDDQYPSAAMPDHTENDGGLIPMRMLQRGDIPSNSFGMHIGSVSSGIPGSLWWGGYDRNRVVGDILSTTVGHSEGVGFRTSLRDLCLDVIDGASPFEFSGNSLNGLLGDISSLNVEIDGCSPYLTLPKPICDKIAEHLPVTHDPGLGLYLWETSSDQYERIVSSASVLSFTLQSASDANALITIRVPFAHLNLTLEKPLVERPTQYFPCFTGGQPGRNVLGRAFLQDAFLGANWGVLKWWLAQAPGPGFSSSTSAVAIGDQDESITNFSEDWASTWKGAWVALDDGRGGGPAVKENDEETTSTTQSSSDGTPTGIVGIGVGAGVAALAIIVAIAYVCWWKRRASRQREPTQPSEQHENQSGTAQYDVSEKSASPKPAEVSGSSSERAELWTNGSEGPRELASS